MKKKLTTIYYLIALFTICTLSFGVSYSQWQPDLRLTNDPAYSYTSYNNAWCIAASGDTVHVVWRDSRVGGSLEIYYKRSTDGGISWGADMQLTNNPAGSAFPSVSVSGQIVHVVWYDDRNNGYKIYYKRSTNAGTSWGADIQLTNDPNDSGFPSLSVSGSVLHVVWSDSRDGNQEIYYKRSTDSGVSWGSETRLSINSGISMYSSVSVFNQLVFVVWQDNSDGNYEIYYKRSTDGGVSWGSDIRFTNNSGNSWSPAAAISGSVVQVVWSDWRDGNPEIYCKRSTDGGTSWGSDTRLTNNPGYSEHPSVSVTGSIVHVVYEESVGNYEIFDKRSTDGGISWEPDTRLTNNTGQSLNPSVTLSGSVAHVVWYDERDGNTEIYYKRNPSGNIAGIENINTEIPKNYSLSQNYPNPFNPETNIRFSIPPNSKNETSNTKIIIFDILGREIETLVNEQLKPGTYEVDWNGINYTSGIYFYILQTENFTDTKKMVLLK